MNIEFNHTISRKFVLRDRDVHQQKTKNITKFRSIHNNGK